MAAGGTESDAASTQRLFVIMWAVAHIVHLVNHSAGRFSTVTGSATLIVAVLAVRYASNARWLLALAALQLADVVWELPTSPDHWNLVAIVNIAILITWFRHRDHTTLIRRAAPTMRLVLIIAYSAAAIAKYNESFIDPTSSCGVVLAEIASLTVTQHFSQLDYGHIALSLVAESFIALCLVVPRLRTAGALVGMSFHFLVSLSPAMLVADFTVTLLALFFLFLPSEHRHALSSQLRDRMNRLNDVPPLHIVLFALSAGGLLGYVGSFPARAVLWFLVTVYAFSVVRSAWSSRTRESRPVSAWTRSPEHLAVGALILVVAASPYIGLRTTGVFTMFSNLRTEGATSNHLFMPSVDPLGWQGDLVELRSASSTPLESWADDGQSIPRVAIARRVHADPTLVVTGSSEGVETTFGPSGAGIEEPGWFIQRFTTFRAVDESRPNPCSG